MKLKKRIYVYSIIAFILILFLSTAAFFPDLLMDDGGKMNDIGEREGGPCLDEQGVKGTMQINPEDKNSIIYCKVINSN